MLYFISLFSRTFGFFMLGAAIGKKLKQFVIDTSLAWQYLDVCYLSVCNTHMYNGLQICPNKNSRIRWSRNKGNENSIKQLLKRNTFLKKSSEIKCGIQVKYKANCIKQASKRIIFKHYNMVNALLSFYQGTVQ